MTSKIKVDNINKVSDDSNIINKCGTTITLGASGDSIALASGASQTGFGRTGTVDWQTSSIKTSTFTAVSGQGFFCDTDGGSFTCNLPAGSAGAIVSLQDYRNTFDTNALTVKPNGSEKINGGSAGGSLSLGTEGEGLTLVYIDSTIGWRSIQDNDFATQGSTNLIATGGTVTCTGDFKIHTFTGPGTFCVSQVSSTAADNTVGYMVVAGGAGGGATQGSWGGGGGGAGGFREGRNAPVDNFTASPLVANAPTNAVTVTVQGYPITVGAGGARGDCGTGPSAVSPVPSGSTTGAFGCGAQGANSIFATITAAGGGFGGGGLPVGPPRNNPGGPGGSGGGNASAYWGGPCGSTSTGGTGNIPSVSPAQGSSAGGAVGHVPASSYSRASTGGGGATAASANSLSGGASAGGAGATTSINNSPVTYAGGGGGGGAPPCAPSGAAGGSGGGGAGGMPSCAVAGTANTGGGGGGGGNPGIPNPVGKGAAGGSGIVIVRYKYK
jgi:hypothetical protein